MKKPSKKKVPENKIIQVNLQESGNFTSNSLPKRDMIMPQEFNSVSNPAQEDSISRGTTLHSAFIF